MKTDEETHELVKKAYGSVAVESLPCCQAEENKKTISCCGENRDWIIKDHPVPESELGLSCGNPLAFSLLKKGDTVLDLGSGAGKDVFLSVREVGPLGRVIGVDMTPEMLALARRNAEKFSQQTGLNNFEFREGYIENLPIESASIDVVISNCVINLSPDKRRVFQEVFRVLHFGGKMVVSDILLNQALPSDLKEDKGLYASCVAGALLREEYLEAISKAGFRSVEILKDISYTIAQVGSDPITAECGGHLEGIASSVTVMATK